MADKSKLAPGMKETWKRGRGAESWWGKLVMAKKCYPFLRLSLKVPISQHLYVLQKGLKAAQKGSSTTSSKFYHSSTHRGLWPEFPWDHMTQSILTWPISLGDLLWARAQFLAMCPKGLIATVIDSTKSTDTATSGDYHSCSLPIHYLLVGQACERQAMLNTFIS